MTNFRTTFLPIVFLVIGLIILATAAAFGQTRDITGIYAATGTNPGGRGAYRGDVIVVEDGEVYQVAWTIAGARHVGTGVLRGNQFSVVYAPEGQGTGIAVYELQPDGNLDGVWTNLGGSTLGSERWIPQGRT